MLIIFLCGMPFGPIFDMKPGIAAVYFYAAAGYVDWLPPAA